MKSWFNNILYFFELSVPWLFFGSCGVFFLTKRDEGKFIHISGCIFLVFSIYLLGECIYKIGAFWSSKVLEKNSSKLCESYDFGRELTSEEHHNMISDFRKLVAKHIYRNVILKNIFAFFSLRVKEVFTYNMVDMYWILKDWQMVEKMVESTKISFWFKDIDIGILICSIGWDYKNGKLWEYKDFEDLEIFNFNKLTRVDKDYASLMFLFAGMVLEKKKKKKEALKVVGKANIILNSLVLEQFIEHLKTNKIIPLNMPVPLYCSGLDLYGLLNAKEPKDFFKDHNTTPTFSDNL